MRRNQRGSARRYVPYSPLDMPVRGNYVSPVPPNVNFWQRPAPPNATFLQRPIYTPSPYNPNEAYCRQGMATNFRNKSSAPPHFCPPLPRFPTPSDLGMGNGIKNGTVPFNSGEMIHKSEDNGRTASSYEATEHGSNPENRPEWKPVKSKQGRKKAIPPPPPPLNELALAKKKVASPVLKKLPYLSKGVESYKVPTSPAEEALRLCIVATVKKLLKHKKLTKKVFKFVCKHVSLNVFSILSAKKDISNPEKLLRTRIKKITKLVDDECARVELYDKMENEQVEAMAAQKSTQAESGPKEKPVQIDVAPLEKPIQPDILPLENEDMSIDVHSEKPVEAEVLLLDKPDEAVLEKSELAGQEGQEKIDVENLQHTEVAQGEKEEELD